MFSFIQSKMSEHESYFNSEEATQIARKILSSKTIELVSFELRPFSDQSLGYLSAHNKLTIIARKNAEEKTLTFFVKTYLLNCDDFQMKIFHEESRFFKEVMPEMMVGYRGIPWAPECHLVNERAFVLEDLEAQGFKSVNESLTIEQLKAAIMSLARFHACSFLVQARLKKPMNELFPGFAEEKVFIKDGLPGIWLETGIEVFEYLARDLNLNEKYVREAYDLVIEAIKPEVERAHWNVLCHQDLWSNNMMFRNVNGETECRILDFQMIVYTCFVADLIIFLYINTTKDTRLRVERELIELYHSVLEKALVNSNYNEKKIVSLEELLECIEEKRIIGLVASAQFSPIDLLNDEFTEAYSKDTKTTYKHSYISRKDFVSNAMLADENYRDRLRELAVELIEFMEKFNR